LVDHWVQLVLLTTSCTPLTRELRRDSTSTGLGRDLVNELLSHGELIIATARSVDDKIADLQKAGAKTLQLDVTSSLDLKKTAEEAVKLFGHIDVLVNNAGYISTGLIEETRYVSS
jgi:NAD(P)-dependent dehydrogenase (short-subunit alcohol dehydrogenase family)